MIEEVYDYLREYGFTKEELRTFEEKNYKLFGVNYSKVKDNINFLEGFNLSREDILKIVREDNYLLTLSNKKKEYLNKIYFNTLGFSREEVKNLLINNPDIYIDNPIMIEKTINYLMSEGYNINEIKNLIKENPKVLDIELEDNN